MSAAEAGVAVGVSVCTGWKWFADGGGVKPEFTDDKPCKWARLPLEERVEITVGDAFCYARDSAQDPYRKTLT
jgi:transposase, IS30 family